MHRSSFSVPVKLRVGNYSINMKINYEIFLFISDNTRVKHVQKKSVTSSGKYDLKSGRKIYSNFPISKIVYYIKIFYKL